MELFALADSCMGIVNLGVIEKHRNKIFQWEKLYLSASGGHSVTIAKSLVIFVPECADKYYSYDNEDL